MRQSKETVSPMSNEGRNAYVIEHLHEALLSLLAQKPLEKISISELVMAAGVGRASFYRNYHCKEDIIKEHLHMLFQEWRAVWEQSADALLSEQMRAMISHFEHHRQFYQLLSKRGMVYLIKDVIIEMLDCKPEQDMAQAYASAFAAYSLYGWIEMWFQRGMRESGDEIAGLFQAQGL